MHGVLLRKFDYRRDLDLLRVSMLESKDRHLFSYNIPINTFQDFEKWISECMKSYYHDFYMICADDVSNAVGFIYSFDYSNEDLHCKICAYICPKFRKCALGGFAILRFLDILFMSYPLRKVYSTVFSYNKHSRLSAMNAGFTEESVLKGYKYYNGFFSDMYILSITRENFYSRFKTILEGDDD